MEGRNGVMIESGLNFNCFRILNFEFVIILIEIKKHLLSASAFLISVGMTRFERATTRPPDVSFFLIISWLCMEVKDSKEFVNVDLSTE